MKRSGPTEANTDKWRLTHDIDPLQTGLGTGETDARKDVLSPVELMKKTLARIDGPKPNVLNAFVTLRAEAALEEAEKD